MTVRSRTCLCRGICHCTNCRKVCGSASAFYAVWPAHELEHVGEMSEFHGQHFCPCCGSRLFSVDCSSACLLMGFAAA